MNKGASFLYGGIEPRMPVNDGHIRGEFSSEEEHDGASSALSCAEGEAGVPLELYCSCRLL